MKSSLMSMQYPVNAIASANVDYAGCCPDDLGLSMSWIGESDAIFVKDSRRNR